jgi:MFS family permease
VAHPFRSLGVLGFAALGYSLAQTAIFPALPDMIRDLDTNANDIAWTLSAFFLSAAVFTPLLGRLGDMFGKRRLFVVGMLLFGLGAVVSATSTGLWGVVAGRVLQGAGGVVYPLCFGMTRDLVPRRYLAQSVAVISATTGMGGAFGLVLGGLMTDAASWQWIFWLAAIMSAASIVAVRLLVPESPGTPGGRVDVRGAVVLGIGLGMPLFGISRATAWGWTDTRTVGLIVGGLVVLAAWARLELHTEEPLADIESLRSRPVLMTNVATFLVGFASLAVFALVPQIAQAPTGTGYGLGLDAVGAGLMLAPGSIVMVLLSPVAGSLGRRVGGMVPLTIGLLVGAAAICAVAFVHETRAQLTVLFAMMMAGNALSLGAIPNLIMASVPPAQTAEAASANYVIQRIVVAGSALPTEHGFRNALLVSGVLSAVAILAGLAIPRSTARDVTGKGESRPTQAEPAR